MSCRYCPALSARGEGAASRPSARPRARVMLVARRLDRPQGPRGYPAFTPATFSAPAGERRPWLAFVVNLKNAKTLGLTIPQTLLATADEVIH
jgi:hypothetical protein